MQAVGVSHAAPRFAQFCPRARVNAKQKSSGVQKAESALQAGGRRRGLLQRLAPERALLEQSCLRLARQCQPSSGAAKRSLLPGPLPVQETRDLSTGAVQGVGGQSPELRPILEHGDVNRQSASRLGDVSEQCRRLPGGVRWRHLALALVALLLVAWRRPAPALAEAAAGGGDGGAAFKFGAFGLRGSLTDRTPGLAYFALLMAAGCGLFVSEEALNVWVGGSLGRCLVLNGSREALLQSLRSSGGYIASVVFWVYWGVCLSDLIPFYAGRWAAQRGESVKEKLGGTNQATLARVTSTVRKYGRYIGFVERFSLGVRNPTAFLAGFSGVSTPTFFAGVCAGGLITLPLQMGLGFALRDRPVAALATVAAVVGTWTIIPYASAAFAAAWFFVKQRLDKQRDVSPDA